MFDLTRRCSTSGKDFNCGLNCITHFIAHKLEVNELQSKGNTPGYDALLDILQAYYELPNKPTWEDMHHFFNALPNPQHREALFSPVLRIYLKTVLLEDENVIQVAQNMATPFIQSFFTNPDIVDTFEPIFKSNQIEFLQFKKRYDNNPALKAALEKEAMDYWYSAGYLKYANYMGSFIEHPMLSFEHLDMLAKTLDIDLELNVLNRAENSVEQWNSPKGEGWILKLLNIDKIHWEFECPETDPSLNLAKTLAHNQYYSDYVTDDDYYIKFLFENATNLLKELSAKRKLVNDSQLLAQLSEQLSNAISFLSLEEQREIKHSEIATASITGLNPEHELQHSKDLSQETAAEDDDHDWDIFRCRHQESR